MRGRFIAYSNWKEDPTKEFNKQPDAELVSSEPGERLVVKLFKKSGPKLEIYGTVTQKADGFEYTGRTEFKDVTIFRTVSNQTFLWKKN